jgi:hypothetical protein
MPRLYHWGNINSSKIITNSTQVNQKTEGFQALLTLKETRPPFPLQGGEPGAATSAPLPMEQKQANKV